MQSGRSSSHCYLRRSKRDRPFGQSAKSWMGSCINSRMVVTGATCRKTPSLLHSILALQAVEGSRSARTDDLLKTWTWSQPRLNPTTTPKPFAITASLPLKIVRTVATPGFDNKILSTAESGFELQTLLKFCPEYCSTSCKHFVSEVVCKLMLDWYYMKTFYKVMFQHLTESKPIGVITSG